MKILSVTTLLLIALTTFAGNQSSADFTLIIEVPKINVSEYHAPYIASWIEDSNHQTVIPTSLWYDNQKKWLKDIRQWWRKTGRTQSAPYDGVTGATRKPGKHKITLKSDEIASHLKKGKYSLFIEASREVGGREVLEIPFDWPLTENFTKSVNGQFELSTVTLQIKFNQ